MGRDDKSLFEEKSSIMFTEGRFLLTVSSALTFHGVTRNFNKRQLAPKKKNPVGDTCHSNIISPLPKCTDYKPAVQSVFACPCPPPPELSL